MAKHYTRVEVLTVVCGGFPVLCAECALSSSIIPVYSRSELKLDGQKGQ